MKKILTMAVAAIFSAVSFAQETAENALKIKLFDNDSVSFLLSSIQDIAIEEVKPLSMDIQVSDITDTSMTVDFPKPEDCSFWLMSIRKEELKGTMQEKRAAMWQTYNDRFDDSRYFRISNLDPGTTYHIYALMFDETGVAAGLAYATATTLDKKENDKFSITVNETTKTYASLTFTPKDNTMKYYYNVVSASEREQMISQYGSLQKAELEYIKYNAESSGFSLDEWLGYVLVQGTKTADTRDITSASLTPGTFYYAFCFGMNTDGTFTTDIYEKEFATETVVPSENVITCEVLKTYSDGCDVKTTVTNDDPYIVTTQTKEVWEKYLSLANGDKKLAARELLRISYSGYVDNYTMSGSNNSFKVSTSSSDTDCVLIVCGYDADVTTDVQTIEYRTLAE